MFFSSLISRIAYMRYESLQIPYVLKTAISRVNIREEFCLHFFFYINKNNNNKTKKNFNILYTQ